MSQNEELKCNFCNKLYSTKYSRIRHEEKCKNNLEVEKLNKDIFDRDIVIDELKNIIIEKDNIIKQLKSQIFTCDNYFNEDDHNDNHINNMLFEELEHTHINETKQQNLIKIRYNDFVQKYITLIKTNEKIEIKIDNSNYNLFKIKKKQNNKK